MRGRVFWSVVAGLLLSLPASAQPAASDPRLAALTARIDATKTAMMSDPAKALALADQTLALARSLPATPPAQLGVATAEWLKGWAYISLNQASAAAPLIEDGLRIANRLAPDTKLQGDLLRSRGAIAATAGRMQDSLQSYQQAFAVFAAAHEPRSQAMMLEDIGQIYKDAGDYRRALGYYAQMADTYRKDHVLLLTGANDRAELLQKLGRTREAEDQYKGALREARALNSVMLETQVLLNMAAVQAKRHEIAAAQVSVARALQLTRTREAATWRPFAFGTAAIVASEHGDVAGAGRLLDQTFAGVDLTTTDASFLIFHQTASDVYDRLHRPDLALAHLRAYHRLEDGARDLTASFGAQLMSARFDFANQNLRISQLKQGQLARDVKIERQRSLLLAGTLAAGLVVFILMLFAFFSIRRSRNEVRAANVALTGVNTQLEKALAAKAEFLATTSHEIRTPLNGILGMTQVLLAGRVLAAEVREQVEVIHAAGETMRALVDDILDVAKMETGEVSIAQAPARVRQVLLDAARLWRGHAENKGLALTLDAGDVPAAILSDEGRLRQIVSNLLSNAVKFTEHGSITLRATVAYDAEGAETLQVAVTDTGIGIPAEQQPLVFEPFHQVDGATTRQFSGTGLGLTICRRLAEALGGTLTLDSEPGVGTSFTLQIPLERVVAASSGTHTPVERPDSLAAATVLLVEANPLAQGILRSLLEPHVGTLEAVADGDLALASLAGGHVHHLLIEAGSARVEGMDVPEALRTVIAQGTAAGAVSTLLAAADRPLPAADLPALGATQLVMKPVAAAALLAAMRELYATPVAIEVAA